MKSKNKRNGFAILLLDIIFVAIGIFLLIIGLLENKEILKETTATLVR